MNTDKIWWDRKTFQSMRYNKKRMFNDDMIEQFLRLGISPGAANVEAFGRVAWKIH